MIYLAVLAFGVTLGLPIAVIFAPTAQGKATSTALEGMHVNLNQLRKFKPR